MASAATGPACREWYRPGPLALTLFALARLRWLAEAIPSLTTSAASGC
jgi:hypothetical protein